MTILSVGIRSAVYQRWEPLAAFLAFSSTDQTLESAERGRIFSWPELSSLTPDPTGLGMALNSRRLVVDVLLQNPVLSPQRRVKFALTEYPFQRLPA